MKEYHDLFLQSRDKKRDSKLSRIVEEPKIADIKPAAIERPKIPINHQHLSNTQTLLLNKQKL